MSTLSDVSAATASASSSVSAPIYQFKPFVSGVSAASGFRVAAVKFKTDKKSGVKKESKYAELPTLSSDWVRSNVGILSDAIKTWCEETQDLLLREAILTGAESISADAVSAEAIANYMRESAVSGRLSGDQIAAWFDAEMEAKLMLALASKLGIDENSPIEEQKKIESAVAVYKEKIVSLASGRVKFNHDVAEKILRSFQVTELENQEDGICEKLVGKLKVMLNAPEAVDLFAL